MSDTMTADSLIDALGGTTKVAEGLGIDPPVVSNWRERGIPPKRWPALIDLAKAKQVRGITWERLSRAQPAAEVRP